MSIQAINAQPLKSEVSFKAKNKQNQPTDKKGMSTGAKVAWTVGGAAALAGITFAAIKMVKGKGSGKQVVSEVKQNIIDKIKAEAPQTAESLKRQSQEAQNVRFKNDAAEIVENFEKMDRKAKAHGLTQAAYEKMNWEAAPMTRVEVLAQKAK